MPEQKSVVLFPPALIVLDIIGTVLFGLGLAKIFAGVDVIPVALRFERYDLILVGAGGALMLPFFVRLLKDVFSAEH